MKINKEIDIDSPLKEITALSSYLDEMLHEATQTEATVPQQTIDIQPVISVEPEPRQPSSDLELSQFPIQCLMFRVGDQLLSLPLVRLNGALLWNDNICHLPQSPDWLLGVLKYRDANLKVVDSAKALGIAVKTEHIPQHILVLDDNQWALSCDVLGDVVTVEYNDIHWHKNNNISYGVIQQSLAYLLNPTSIMQSLHA